MRAVVQTLYLSCCDEVIDEVAKQRSDVVECGRKSCETRWVREHLNVLHSLML